MMYGSCDMVRDGRTDGQTDGQTDGNWHIELGAPPKKKTLFSYFSVTQSTPKPQEKNAKQIFTSISFSVTLEMKKIHDKVLKTPLCLGFWQTCCTCQFPIHFWGVRDCHQISLLIKSELSELSSTLQEIANGL